ncbi:E3 ubiquitin-protein ligase Zswim2 [Homalodisca vitripennis]|nr:E3 ubiquitin-protein ligase Zswim2 [Homalodisca vitripennis]
MARAAPWRQTCPQTIRSIQQLAVLSPLFLLRQSGPAAYIVQESDAKPVQVRLGDPHYCSCKDHQKSRDLCLHICWVLLKKLQLKPFNALSYQIRKCYLDIFVERRKVNGKKLFIGVGRGIKSSVMKSNIGCYVRVEAFLKLQDSFCWVHSFISSSAGGRGGREGEESRSHLIDLDFFMIPHFFISRLYRWLLTPPLPATPPSQDS